MQDHVIQWFRAVLGTFTSVQIKQNVYLSSYQFIDSLILRIRLILVVLNYTLYIVINTELTERGLVSKYIIIISRT